MWRQMSEERPRGRLASSILRIDVGKAPYEALGGGSGMPVLLGSRAPDSLKQRMHGPSRRPGRPRMGTQARDADGGYQRVSALRNIPDLALYQRFPALLWRAVSP